ncbi:MAG: FtsX-like permease family protein [Thermoplasmata archaeon]|nr:FtsX-like permease family protein [Thermoplasmata archaeon]
MTEADPFTPLKYIYASIARRAHMSGVMVALLVVSSLLLLLALSFSVGARAVEEPGAPRTIWSETPVKPLLREMGFMEEISPEARDAMVRIFYLSSIISLLVGYVLLRAVFTVSLKERRREIALLSALGFSRGEVMKLLLGEGGILALISAVAALYLAMPLFVNLGSYMISKGEASMFFTQPRISPIVALVSIGVVLGITLLAEISAISEVEREEGRLL